MPELYQVIESDCDVLCDEWHGCYRGGWGSLLVDEAYAHPAKIARGLVEKIYEHVISEQWVKPGDRVVDPFGGIAGCGLHAMMNGLHFIGVELETKFVGLGNQNIALWNERFSRMPNWGTARLLQGDSRKLVEVMSAADCCVASPPYANDTVNDRNGIDLSMIKKPGGHNSQSRKMSNYGESSGQLGAMKEGDLNLAISSPPYIDAINSGKNGIDWDKARKQKRDGDHYVGEEMKYGSTEGQLGAMPEGQLCVTSPPYNPPMSQDHNGSRGGQRGTTPSEKGAFVKYGTSEGQLEGMSMEGHAIAISSPPYATGDSAGPESLTSRNDKSAKAMFRSQGWREGGQVSEGNLAASGETFWSASRLILEQLHQVIAPSGHAVFVVKAFVRDKKIVDFPGQWAQLCEAVGFRLLHHHRASLVEHSGTQGGFHEDKEIKVERKSFFRRLAESKGSPRIDHESVLCFERT